jgi:hypothetical protein
MKCQFMSKFLESRRAVGVSSFVMAMAATWVLAGLALAAPLTTTAPSITGAPVQEGRAVSFVQGVWSDATAVTVTDGNWQLCTPSCTDTGQSVATPYTIPANTASGTVQVLETAVATDGTSTLTATSTPILPPAPASAAPAPSVSASAPPLQGQTLTAVHGGWSPSPTTIPTTFTDAWQRCLASTCNSTGVSGPTYLLGPADVGYSIEFVETAANAGGSSTTSETSAPTAAVVAPPGNLILPTITGTPQQGQVLTVTPGTWANTPTSIVDQWEDCTSLACTPIVGQTGNTYTLGPSDVGHTIQVAETAFNAAALTGVFPVASARTATVSATSITSLVVYSQNTPTANQAVTLVATILSGSGNASPHGSLSFLNGASPVSGCANKGVSGGQTVTVVCQASFGAGAAHLSAAYAADPTSLVADSVSDPTALTVGKVPTSIALAVTPQVAPGGRARYVATLQMPLSNAGPLLPSGSIEFLDGGQPIGACADQSLSANTATCSVGYPSAGGHSITARYDGDDNFTGSTSSADGVQIVQGAAKAPAVHAVLGSTLGWTVHFSPHYSWLTTLTAFAVSKGTIIVVQCLGKSCPFVEWQIKHPAGRIDLARRFRHRHLRAGTRITVRFTRKGWVGKSYSFKIRAGHKPKVTTVCLAPGRVKPVACSST